MNSQTKDDLRVVRSVMDFKVVFYEEKSEGWGSNNISYEIYGTNGRVTITEIGAFGDGTLISVISGENNRKLTFDEMIDIIQEINQMRYGEFKEKFLTKESISWNRGKICI